MVGVAGVPGAGKSMSCALLAEELRKARAKSEGGGGGVENVLVLPADGYHRPLADLDANKNEVYERGAEHTFDKFALREDLLKLRGSDATVAYPGFDHAKGDPAPGQHMFTWAVHRVVVVSA